MKGAGRAADTRQGFTLIEVMITLVILAFGLLTLALMQLHAMRQGSQGRHTGDGAAIARSYLEQASRIPWADLDGAEAAGIWVNPGWSGIPTSQVDVEQPAGAGAATEKDYTVEWKVSDVGVAPVCLRDVEVRVSWNEEQSTVAKTVVLSTRRYNEGDPNC